MSAIAFNLLAADTAANHSTGLPQAYADIGAITSGFGFSRVQPNLYLSGCDDLTNFCSAIIARRRSLGFHLPSETSGLSKSSTGPISRSS